MIRKILAKHCLNTSKATTIENGVTVRVIKIHREECPFLVFQINLVYLLIFFSINCWSVTTAEEKKLLTGMRVAAQSQLNTPDAGLKLILIAMKNNQTSIKTTPCKQFIDSAIQHIEEKSALPQSFRASLEWLLTGQYLCPRCDDRARDSNEYVNLTCGHLLCIKCLSVSDDCDANTAALAITCPICSENQPCCSNTIESGETIPRTTFEQAPCCSSAIPAANSLPIHINNRPDQPLCSAQLSKKDEPLWLAQIAGISFKTCPKCQLNFEYEGQGSVTCSNCKLAFCASCEAEHNTKTCSEYYHSLNQKEQSALATKRCCQKTIFDDQEDKAECCICMQDKLRTSLADLQCGDPVCITCLISYINETEGTKNINGEPCVNCPSCDIAIPRNILLLIMPVDKVLRKNLEDFTLQGGGRFCPAGCGLVIAADEVDGYVQNNQPFNCPECHKEGCLLCHKTPYHYDLTCDDFANTDDDTRKLYKTLKAMDAQACPECNALLTKINCNRVTCRWCDHEFCWKCGGEWRKYRDGDPYDPHSRNCTCNIFTKERNRTLNLKNLKKSKNAESEPSSSGWMTLWKKILPWAPKKR